MKNRLISMWDVVAGLALGAASSVDQHARAHPWQTGIAVAVVLAAVILLVVVL